MGACKGGVMGVVEAGYHTQALNKIPKECQLLGMFRFPFCALS